MDKIYKKRTQKDYSLSLKLQIVQEIEQGLLTSTGALEKYGVRQLIQFELGLKNMVTFTINIPFIQWSPKLQEQGILELEQQIPLLEKQKNRAEYLADRADKKVILFDMMIDYAEKEFNIPIRKMQDPK